MAYALKLPGRSTLGEGALAAAEANLAALGKKALIVTGNIVKKSEAFARLTAILDRNSVGWAVFSDIPGEPDDRMIDAGAAAFSEFGCDFLIGLGGGSPLDSAKAVAVRTALPGGVTSHAGREIIGDFPKLALIPTTAGTGSEATKFTVITDSGKGAKLLLKGDGLLPDLAVVDPALTLSAPPALTAATGMDALTHAAEAFTSKKATPLTDPYALDAIRRILSSLPRAYRDGGDIEARSSMAVAAYEAGVCISNASVTIVHGMSRPIGAKFHVPHGLSNAMLLAPCLRFAAAGCPERFATLARGVGVSPEGADDDTASRALIAAFARLTEALDVPTLSGYGIPEADFRAAIPQMAREAFESGSPGNTLRDVTEEDIVRLYETLY
jgi:alcohol dehydrogenase class IV